METSVRFVSVVVTTILLFTTVSLAAERLDSGLKPGEKITTIFEPLNVNGPNAGEPHCLVCENGLSPVAMIWARDISEPLSQLLARLDAQTVKHSSQEMGSFAVFIGDESALEPQLKEVAEKQKLKKLVLAINIPPIPDEYKLAPDAEVTVMLYSRHKVLANHAFRKGELDGQAVERILADLPKILIEK